MTLPPMLQDIIRMLLALATPAALVCLVLAGVALRRDGGTNFSIGGGFSRWMFWSVVFLTLPQLLSWFPTFGVPTTLPTGGIGIAWMAAVATDVSRFVSSVRYQTCPVSGTSPSATTPCIRRITRSG